MHQNISNLKQPVLVKLQWLACKFNFQYVIQVRQYFLMQMYHFLYID